MKTHSHNRGTKQKRKDRSK